MFRYEPAAVGSINLYCGGGGTPAAAGELLAHLKLLKPTPQSSMYSRVSQLRLLQKEIMTDNEQAN
jgi:hypothetical protein